MRRWQQAEGKRHAVDSRFAPHPGEPFEALCGEQVTAQWSDYPQFADPPRVPTCWHCHEVWRGTQVRHA